MPNRLRRKLFAPETTDEGVVLIPFGFVINGTSDPDGLTGDALSTVARSEAGEFLCTLVGEPAVVFTAHAQCSNTADDVDIYCKVDFSTVASAGTFTVRTMTGATQTDPTNDTRIGGFLVVKKTDRTGYR